MTTIPHRQRAAEKTAPVKFHRASGPPLAKPHWIRASLGNSQRFSKLKELLRAHALHTVCEEARCPNIGECFSSGTATFMILGDVCTRRCAFCDVAHGRPLPPDGEEPVRLAQAVQAMGLNYVVITSVDRDDLPDGGASHFAACVRALRGQVPGIRIEILVPDFRGRLEKALVGLGEALPDVLNHNLETVHRLYPQVRPGSNYQHSLSLLSQFKARYPQIPTKSGVMVGLGETDAELFAAIADLRTHQVDRLTVGQYLAPSRHHHPVLRYVPLETFSEFKIHAEQLGFAHAECGPLVRSSYHAQKQDQPVGVK